MKLSTRTLCIALAAGCLVASLHAVNYTTSFTSPGGTTYPDLIVPSTCTVASGAVASAVWVWSPWGGTWATASANVHVVRKTSPSGLVHQVTANANPPFGGSYASAQDTKYNQPAGTYQVIHNGTAYQGSSSYCVTVISW